MKFIKMLGLVAVLGLISASQIKASIALPSGQNVTVPHMAPSSAVQHLGQMHIVSAVPEPSDWAWVPVLGTIGVIAWRRFSRRSAV